MPEWAALSVTLAPRCAPGYVGDPSREQPCRGEWGQRAGGWGSLARGVPLAGVVGGGERSPSFLPTLTPFCPTAAEPDDPRGDCRCDPRGSVSGQCDARGQCRCKVRRGGVTCAERPQAPHPAPHPCVLCAGGGEEPCLGGPLCSSPRSSPWPRLPTRSPLSPQPNAEGPSCSSCRAGHFHLSTESHEGCLPCFCMGVTQQCTSSSSYRDLVRCRVPLPAGA